MEQIQSKLPVLYKSCLFEFSTISVDLDKGTSKVFPDHKVELYDLTLANQIWRLRGFALCHTILRH